jgi:hypothetical protein
VANQLREAEQRALDADRTRAEDLTRALKSARAEMLRTVERDVQRERDAAKARMRELIDTHAAAWLRQVGA